MLSAKCPQGGLRFLLLSCIAPPPTAALKSGRGSQGGSTRPHRAPPAAGCASSLRGSRSRRFPSRIPAACALLASARRRPGADRAVGAARHRVARPRGGRAAPRRLRRRGGPAPLHVRGLGRHPAARPGPTASRRAARRRLREDCAWMPRRSAARPRSTGSDPCSSGSSAATPRCSSTPARPIPGRRSHLVAGAYRLREHAPGVVARVDPARPHAAPAAPLLFAALAASLRCTPKA